MLIDADTSTCLVQLPERTRWDPEVLAGVQKLDSAIAGDAMNRLGLMHSSVSRRTTGQKCVGPALTIHAREGDNLAIHMALDVCLPGDILVVDGGGHCERAIFGEILARFCVTRGVIGAVLSGAVRDIDGIGRLDFPVWAMAVTPAGPTRSGPGSIGATVSCAGVVVRTDDLIVADGDGVAVIPQQRCTEILQKAHALLQQEERMLEAARNKQ